MAEKKKPSRKAKKAKKPVKKAERKPGEGIPDKKILEKPAAMKDIKKEKAGPKPKKGVPLLLGIAVIVIVGAIAAVLIYAPDILGPLSGTGETVGTGDNITISYSVVSRDGEFEQEGVYDFIVGQEMAIEGVDQGVIGMRMGETRTLSIPPEEGYGEFDPMQTVDWPLVQEVEKVVNITAEMFNMNFGEEAVIGKSYDTVVYPWNATVTSIEDGLVFMEQMPEDGQVVELPYGNTTVGIKGDRLEITLSPIIGEQFTAVYGPNGFPEILEANETDMTLDLNHPLAGKTLDFTITIVNIIPNQAGY